MESEVCMHLSEGFWTDTCKFFRHDPQLRHANYLVEVQGFGRKLLPVQAHAVYWSFLRFNGIEGSVFLGHVMGVGKSTMVLAIHHIQHRINHIHEHISQNPKLHLQTPHSKQDDNAICPINQKIIEMYGFHCVCFKSSPTSFMRKVFGFTSLLAPLGLLHYWIRQATECFPAIQEGTTGGPLDCVLVKVHSSSNWPRNVLLELLADEIEHEDENKIPQTSTLSPRLSSSKFFVITVSHSFKRRIISPLTKKRSWLFHPRPEKKVNRKGESYLTKPVPKQMLSAPYPTAIIGMQVRDEFHQEKNATSPTISALNHLLSWQDVRRYPVRLCALSGTPLSTGPGDMAHYIKCMIRPEWKRHPVLKQWMNDEIVEVSAEWDAGCKKRNITPAMTAKIVGLFTPLYEQLMLRFTNTSDFLGAGPVVTVPESKFVTIMCDNTTWEQRLNDSQKEEDQRLAKAEKIAKKRWQESHAHGSLKGYTPRQNNLPGSYHRQRLYASVPGLMDLVDHNGQPLSLTQLEWKSNLKKKMKDGVMYTAWVPETPTDPYFLHIQDLAKSSAKLQAIGKIIKMFASTIDAEGKPARLIFASFFMPGAYVIYLVSKS